MLRYPVRRVLKYFDGSLEINYTLREYNLGVSGLQLYYPVRWLGGKGFGETFTGKLLMAQRALKFTRVKIIFE